VFGVLALKRSGHLSLDDVHSLALASLYKLEYMGHSGYANVTVASPDPAESIPVLLYHGILKKPDLSNINVTTENFKDQMFALKNAGYQTVTTDDLYKYMRGEIKLPARS